MERRQYEQTADTDLNKLLLFLEVPKEYMLIGCT